MNQSLSVAVVFCATLFLSVSSGYILVFEAAAGTANFMTNSTPGPNETRGEAAEEFFRSRGFARPLGWGKHPAVLVGDVLAKIGRAGKAAGH
jgi:hypothetical protein